MKKYFWLFWGLFTMTFPAHSEKHVIAAAELTSLFHAVPIAQNDNPNSYGLYHHILTMIIQKTGLSEKYELIVVPMRRAKQGFLNKAFACYAPGIDTFDRPDEVKAKYKILTTTPINIAKAKLVSARGLPVVRQEINISQNHIISLVRGTPENSKIQQVLARAGEVIRVASEEHNLMQLARGYATHAIVYFPDVLLAYDKLGIPIHEYDENFELMTIEDTVTCHVEFADAHGKIDEELKAMHLSGELKSLLGRSYISK